LADADRYADRSNVREFVRSAPATRAPVAVIDIGSNSVRLVIYDGPWRHAYALHNEKSVCAIGRNMVRTGELDRDGMELALETLERFRLVSAGHGVRTFEAVATAAARDAKNGKEFVALAEKALGQKIRVLSGEDEARIAADGVIAGIPDADGIVADLGGGSLDMVTVRSGRTGGAETLPFGPLRLMDVSDGDLTVARSLVAKGLGKSKLGNTLEGRALYAVGGIWRALARVDMDEQNYPLHVLHHYRIPSSRTLKLCKIVSTLSRKSLDKMKSVPKRRGEALPFGALVLEQMIQVFGLKEVVVSAYGLREGLLQWKLTREEAAKDPLIEFASEWNAREARVPGHGEELFDWMTPLFSQESEAERRVRLAACLMSDIGWRRHPDDRALGAFRQILRGAYAGANHAERALMASAIYYRYSGERSYPQRAGMDRLMGPGDTKRALIIGLAARIAYGISGALAGELSNTPLRVEGEALSLEVPSDRQALLSERVGKHLNDLAKVVGRKSDPLFV
jgi:exopolyphosphatase/guanosine-5'-triphosphate,3'-diphosphate pyrophosphatase